MPLLFDELSYLDILVDFEPFRWLGNWHEPMFFRDERIVLTHNWFFEILPIFLPSSFDLGLVKRIACLITQVQLVVTQPEIPLDFALFNRAEVQSFEDELRALRVDSDHIDVKVENFADPTDCLQNFPYVYSDAFFGAEGHLDRSVIR